MKITIFKTDTRVSIKFEDGHLEQTYKFNQQNGLDGLEGVRLLIDDDFLGKIEAQFQLMEKYRSTTLAKYFPGSLPDEFDEII